MVATVHPFHHQPCSQLETGHGKEDLHHENWHELQIRASHLPLPKEPGVKHLPAHCCLEPIVGYAGKLVCVSMFGSR